MIRPLVSPYARWNLRRNPFGELTRAERAELAVVEVTPWLESLRCPTTAIQFIGPCGYGKTTHLLALLRHLPDASYLYLPPAAPAPPLPSNRPLLIDEAQRLPWHRRWQVTRVPGPLVLGTHQDLSGWLRRAGFQVTTVDVERNRDPQRLQQILSRRIEASRIDERPVPAIDQQQCRALHDRFGGNLREIESHLYEVFQQMIETGPL